MFGKGKKRMSGTDRFVMERGREAGNLKAPLTKTSVPKHTTPVKERPLSPGKAGPVKIV